MMLDRILDVKRREVVAEMEAVSIADLERQASLGSPPCSFTRSIRRLAGDRINLIAEIKRASPSKGLLNSGLDAAATARSYAAAGAAAISVLTDRTFFQGSPADLQRVREVVAVPVLRKDFVIYPYQVWQARAWGADAVLLIVAALAQEELAVLLRLAGELGLAALVEVHDARELERALEAGATVLGINNRNLNTFEVDLGNCLRLRPLAGDQCVTVAESGVRCADDVRQLDEAGFDAVLVGEALVTGREPEKTVRELLGMKKR